MTPIDPPWAILIPLRSLAIDPTAIPSFDAVSDSAVYLVGDGGRAAAALSSVPMVLDGDRERAVLMAVKAGIQPRFDTLAQTRIGKEVDIGYHAGPMRDVAAALRRGGFRLTIFWSLKEADALDAVSLSGGPALDDECAQALADIKEWFADNEATAIVENLEGPATLEDIENVETKLGHKLPLELRALYAAQDGQRNPDRNLFFPYSGFLGLSLTLRETDRTLAMHFDVPPHRQGVLELKDVGYTTMLDDFLPQERTTAWFCFGADDNFSKMVHLESGRVFEWVRQEGIRLLANSFRDYLMGFATDLWNDAYRMNEDRELERRR